MVVDRDGLYLRVRRSGSKSFVFRKTRNGRPSITTLGRAGNGGLTLAVAREKVTIHRRARTAWSKLTLVDLLEEWFDESIADTYKRPHHVRGYIDKVPHDLSSERLIDLCTPDITTFLKRHKKQSGPVGANRFLAILKQAFRYAEEMGYIESSPIAKVSRKTIGGEELPRRRVLSEREIRLLWDAPSSNTLLLRFLLLTAQRISEAQNAKWSDIEGDVWLINENKSDRPHFCILSPQALALLDELERVPESEMVFQHKGTQFPATNVQAWLRRFCAKHNIDPNFTPHDLRRTARTRMAELGIDPIVAEKILNHSLGGILATYDQADYEDARRLAMSLWANELDRILASE